MNNNDIFKKLRVALQLRDDQIVAILELVDFRMSKGEIGNFFRNADHPNFMECGDQVLRNFLNGLVIHLRGTKENPKNAMDVKMFMLQSKVNKIKLAKSLKLNPQLFSSLHFTIPKYHKNLSHLNNLNPAYIAVILPHLGENYIS